jgi:hypothetical protein
MRKMHFALAAAALLATAPAHAASFLNFTNGPDGNPPQGLLTIDFNSASGLGDIMGLSGNAQIVQGSVSGQYAAPFGDGTKYLSVPKTGSTGTATLDLTNYNFGGVVDGFSFYWGSIDKYNQLVVNSTLGGTAQSYTFQFDGSNPPPPANGAQQDGANNLRVFFGLAQGETLNSIQFVSTGIAFEVDDIIFTGSAVPEPATWAMMIGGFGMIGGAMRRAKRRATPATA